MSDMEKAFEQWWDNAKSRCPKHLIAYLDVTKESMRIAFYAGYRGGQVDMRMEMLNAMRQEGTGATEPSAIEHPGSMEFDGHMGCVFAGPGRGDCAHFIGLPGKSIPGQHDGADDTVDVYGKPNGWCWSCWKDHKLEKLEEICRLLSSPTEKQTKRKS